LVCASDVNLLGYDRDTIRENTGTLTYANQEAGLEVNAEKSKYVFLSSHQNAGQNHNIKIASRFFENMTQFKYLRTRVRN
jgi:hypothetical protein